MPEGLEPLYTAAEMRAAEERYPGFPGTAPELMERAGAAVAREALWRFRAAARVTVVCGGGSNGGDGRIAARILAAAGRDVRVVDATSGERDLGAPDLVVDALFGTGFAGAPRPEAAALIEAVNASGARVLAVDVPSGVDASTGETAGAAVRADATVTFHGRKLGLEVAPGRFHSGDVVVADIGLAHAETAARTAGPDVLRALRRKGPADTKYTAGHVLVVGGAPGLTGAAALAARAAFRADAGYVTVCAPAASLPEIGHHVVEAVRRPLEEVHEAAARAGALALGPGLGRDTRAREIVRSLLASVEVPAVVDADALSGLELPARRVPTVLTPHAGELARLLGVDLAEVCERRLDALRRAVERFGCTVLLKGADTLVASPGSGPVVCALGTPALATAGSGDVLTGVVAAFLARGLDPQLAAVAGAAAHGLAARAAGRPLGLVASDVVEVLPEVLAAHAAL